MERRMEQVKVRTTNDCIEIAQDWHDGEEERIVFIYPEQVDGLVKFLVEAKLEFENNSVSD